MSLVSLRYNLNKKFVTILFFSCHPPRVSSGCNIFEGSLHRCRVSSTQPQPTFCRKGSWVSKTYSSGLLTTAGSAFLWQGPRHSRTRTESWPYPVVMKSTVWVSAHSPNLTYHWYLNNQIFTFPKQGVVIHRHRMPVKYGNVCVVNHLVNIFTKESLELVETLNFKSLLLHCSSHHYDNVLCEKKPFLVRFQ